MVLKIKEWCFRISTLGSLGYLATGGILATLLVIPLLYVYQAVFWFHATLFYALLTLTLLSVVFSIQMALSFPTDKDSSVIVIDRSLAFLGLFLGIPLTFKIIFVGFFLFNLINFLRPFLLYRLWDISLEDLPGAAGVLVGPLATAFILNLFFRFVYWLSL